MSYKARLSQTKEQRDAKAIELAVLEAKLSLEGIISTAKVTKARLEPALDSALSRVPFDFDAVQKIKGEIEAAEERQFAAETLLNEEFAD